MYSGGRVPFLSSSTNNHRVCIYASTIEVKDRTILITIIIIICNNSHSLGEGSFGLLLLMIVTTVLTVAVQRFIFNSQWIRCFPFFFFYTHCFVRINIETGKKKQNDADDVDDDDDNEDKEADGKRDEK